jgi:hypothetical protein
MMVIIKIQFIVSTKNRNYDDYCKIINYDDYYKIINYDGYYKNTNYCVH